MSSTVCHFTSDEVVDLYLEGNYCEIVRIMYELTMCKKHENGFDEVILTVFIVAVSEKNDIFFDVINKSRSMEIDRDLCKTLYKSLITNGDSKYIRHLFDNSLIGRTDLGLLGEAAKEITICEYTKNFDKIIEDPLKRIRLPEQMNDDITSGNIAELIIHLDPKTIMPDPCENLIGSLLMTKYELFALNVLKVHGLKLSEKQLKYMSSISPYFIFRYTVLEKHYNGSKTGFYINGEKRDCSCFYNHYVIRHRNLIDHIRSDNYKHHKNNPKKEFLEALSPGPEDIHLVSCDIWCNFGTLGAVRSENPSYVVNPKTCRRIQIGGPKYFGLVKEGFRLFNGIMTKNADVIFESENKIVIHPKSYCNKKPINKKVFPRNIRQLSNPRRKEDP